jgi:hypothetical protein
LGRLQGRLFAGAEPGRRLDLGEAPIEDRAHNRDDIDQADARFRRPRTLDELMAGVPVITSVDDLAIPELTDEEWEAFQVALKDD